MVVYVYNSHDWASNGTLIVIVMVPLMDINASLYGSSLAKMMISWDVSVFCLVMYFRIKTKKSQDSRVIYSENG